MAFKAIAGLGNPEGYEDTYHNAGKSFLHYAAEGGVLCARKPLFTAYKKEGIIYIEPAAFMNESGGAIAAALNYFKIPAKDFLRAHDDSDIPLGAFKIESGRGAAGHHGVESVIKSLGTKDFARLRIGIRPPLPENTEEKDRPKAGDFVLSRVSSASQKILQRVFDNAERFIRTVIANDTP